MLQKTREVNYLTTKQIGRLKVKLLPFFIIKFITQELKMLLQELLM